MTQYQRSYGRSYNSAKIELQTAKRHRGRQFLSADNLWNNGTPGGCIESKADSHHENRNQNHVRIEQSKRAEKRQTTSRPRQPQLARAEALFPINDGSKGTGRQREKEKRKGSYRRQYGNQEHRRSQRVHNPRRGGGMSRNTYTRDEARNP